ncbi:hypothetical protein HNR42_002512 [Deinobacterium chartae]|uniref:Uncharacterized protein n=1 Tax=Deinobacterium chartae TaxID=521158 RepID=A0A841I1Z0_9DEIO|nr:hypothetical protein [Deinobacterium chartae]MBB6099076.1 hypothetical protein [Deinobacterium chartae]
MKVQWTRNSLRLRISPDELKLLRERQPVREILPVSGGALELRLSPAEQTGLLLEGSVLHFRLSPADLADLLEAREGVYFHQNSVRYYVEKDFAYAFGEEPS